MNGPLGGTLTGWSRTSTGASKRITGSSRTTCRIRTCPSVRFARRVAPHLHICRACGHDAGHCQNACARLAPRCHGRPPNLIAGDEPGRLPANLRTLVRHRNTPKCRAIDPCVPPKELCAWRSPAPCANGKAPCAQAGTLAPGGARLQVRRCRALAEPFFPAREAFSLMHGVPMVCRRGSGLAQGRFSLAGAGILPAHGDCLMARRRARSIASSLRDPTRSGASPWTSCASCSRLRNSCTR